MLFFNLNFNFISKSSSSFHCALNFIASFAFLLARLRFSLGSSALFYAFVSGVPVLISQISVQFHYLSVSCFSVVLFVCTAFLTLSVYGRLYCLVLRALPGIFRGFKELCIIFWQNVHVTFMIPLVFTVFYIQEYKRPFNRRRIKTDVASPKTISRGAWSSGQK
ncbi:hypothetical protein V1506DRAFT_16500 [Lipomyces tetrasporus]